MDLPPPPPRARIAIWSSARARLVHARLHLANQRARVLVNEQRAHFRFAQVLCLRASESQKAHTARMFAGLTHRLAKCFQVVCDKLLISLLLQLFTQKLDSFTNCKQVRKFHTPLTNLHLCNTTYATYATQLTQRRWSPGPKRFSLAASRHKQHSRMCALISNNLVW